MLPVSFSSLSPVYIKKSVASGSRSKPPIPPRPPSVNKKTQTPEELRSGLIALLKKAQDPTSTKDDLKRDLEQLVPQTILSLRQNNNTDSQVLKDLQETGVEATIQVLEVLANHGEMLQALVESQTAQTKSLTNANNKAKKRNSIFKTLFLGIGVSGALAVAVNYFQPKLLPSLLAQIPKLELDQKAVASEHIPICPIKNCKDLLPEKGGSGDYDVLVPGLREGAHTGLDFGSPTGTELVAPFTGKISDWTNARCGTGIQITGTTWKGTYCHMNKVTVEIGKEVKQGEKVGEVGSTGHSTGPHLHFSLYDLLNKKSVNPRYEIQFDPAKPNTAIDLKPVPKPAQPSKKVGKSK